MAQDYARAREWFQKAVGPGLRSRLLQCARVATKGFQPCGRSHSTGLAIGQEPQKKYESPDKRFSVEIIEITPPDNQSYMDNAFILISDNGKQVAKYLTYGYLLSVFGAALANMWP